MKTYNNTTQQKPKTKMSLFLQKQIGIHSPPMSNDSNDYLKEVHNEKYNEKLKSIISFIYFSPQYTKKNNINSKFGQLMDIQNNIFISPEIKEEYFNLFSKSQKNYFAFTKLKHIYRLKKAKVKTIVDLYLNPIDPNHPNSIAIWQNNFLYWFTLSDLKNHIEAALTNCNYFFPEPMECKNPYNNIPFTETQLYNIYFQLRESSYVLSQIIHNYFLCELDIEIFKLENEYMIRDIAINKYTYNTSQPIVYKEMMSMVDVYLSGKIQIDSDAPKDQIINILRPYFHLYLISNFHVSGTDKKRNANQALSIQFYKFGSYNPRFGTKIFKHNKITKKMTTMYNLDHPKFTMRDANKCILKYESARVFIYTRTHREEEIDETSSSEPEEEERELSDAEEEDEESQYQDRVTDTEDEEEEEDESQS